MKLSDEFIAWVEKSIDNVLADQKQVQNELRSQLNTRLAQLSTKADNLVDLVAEGGTVAAKAVARIREIEEQKRAVEQQLGTIQDDLAEGVAQIRGWIELLRDPHELYLNASDEMRRRLNQAIFRRLWVIDLDRVDADLSEPAQLLLEAQMAWQAAQFEQAPMQSPRPPTAGGESADEALVSTHSMHDGNGSSKPRLVDLTRRSSNNRMATKRLVRAARKIRSQGKAIGSRAVVTDDRGRIASVSALRELSESQIEGAIERYRQGEKIMTIAADLGVHRSRVRKEFQARGVTSKRSPLTQEQVERAAELYRGGLSLAAVGEEFGLTGMTVRRYLAEHGVTIRPRQGWESRLAREEDADY